MQNNNNPSNPLSQYKETQIVTASPGKLLLMMYDGAISSMQIAIDLLDDNSLKFDVVNDNLVKAQEIIGELMATLDFEKGGEIAENLQSLYNYFIRKLMEGNINKDSFPVEEVLESMKELKEAWQVAVRNSMKETEKLKPTLPQEKSFGENGGGFSISG